MMLATKFPPTYPIYHVANCPVLSRQRRGTVTYLVAIVIPVFLIFIGFVINLVYLELAQTELRIATDCAARAAGQVWTRTGNHDAAISAAQDAAARNTVAGTALTLLPESIEFGQAQRSSAAARYYFQPTDSQQNAVRVTGQRSHDSADGPVSLVFPTPLGRTDFEPSLATVATQLERDIVFVIDRSSSWTDEIPSGAPPPPASGGQEPSGQRPASTTSRWRALEQSLHRVYDILDASPRRVRVALVTYGNDGRLAAELTDDYGTLREKTSAIRLDMDDSLGSTTAGLKTAQRALEDHEDQRFGAAEILVVITDGDEYSPASQQLEVVQAVQSGMVVFMVTVGPAADQTSARQLARIGLGRHYHVTTATELQAALQEIAQMSPTILAQ